MLEKNLKFLKFPVGGSRSQGFRKYLTQITAMLRPMHIRFSETFRDGSAVVGQRVGECEMPLKQVPLWC